MMPSFPHVFSLLVLLILESAIIVRGFSLSSTPRVPSHLGATGLQDNNAWKKTTNPSNNGVLPREYYESHVYTSDQHVPWDLNGRPQPTVVSAAEEGKFANAWILDCGCGTGENALFLAQKAKAKGVVGFDISRDAIETARSRVESLEEPNRPEFVVASCADVADHAMVHRQKEGGLFDVALDSALLHCLSDEDAVLYVQQLSRLVKRGSGRCFVGCFSDKNPDPWDNPRRLSEENLRALFCEEAGWEVLNIRDTWWSRPTYRGSSQGSFSMALWMEARRL